MSLTQTQACNRLRMAGLSQKDTHAILNQISVWVERSGPEWTVNRLKAIKNQFIQVLAGNTKYRSPWIKVDGHGHVKGPFKTLFVRGLSSKKSSVLFKVLNALMSYSSFTTRRPTTNQLEKFFGSVNRGFTPEQRAAAEVIPLIRPYNGKFRIENPLSVGAIPIMSSKSVPVSQGTKTVKAHDWESWLPDNLAWPIVR